MIYDINNSKVLVASDIHIVVCEGRCYVTEKVSSILRRYANAFGNLVILSRVTHNITVEDAYQDVSDIIDSFIEVSSLIKVFMGAYDRQINTAIATCRLVIARLPSLSGYKAADIARKQGIPYLVECMGCAWDAYWNHGFVGKLIAPYMYFKMKMIVKRADFALYVTKIFLQERYPCTNKSVGVSNVKIENISDDIIVNRVNKINNTNTSKLVLMTAAAVDVKYKGQEYVIKALKQLNRKGIHGEYWLAGSGNNSYLQRVAEKAGVSKQVVFLGKLSLNDVLKKLDQTDCYIQPSLQEGLPRAMIEAMSRGCPCIGTNTAGIPELLPAEYIVERKSVTDIVKVISNLTIDSMKESARVNFQEAKNYTEDVLERRRNDYFEYIKKWLGEHQ